MFTVVFVVVIFAVVVVLLSRANGFKIRVVRLADNTSLSFWISRRKR